MGRCGSWTGGKDRRLLTSAGLLLQWIGSSALIKDGRPLLRQQLLIALPGGGSGRGQSGPGGFESSPPHRSRSRPAASRRRLPGAGVGAGGWGRLRANRPGRGAGALPQQRFPPPKGWSEEGIPLKSPVLHIWPIYVGFYFYVRILPSLPSFYFSEHPARGLGVLICLFSPSSLPSPTSEQPNTRKSMVKDMCCN